MLQRITMHMSILKTSFCSSLLNSFDFVKDSICQLFMTFEHIFHKTPFNITTNREYLVRNAPLEIYFDSWDSIRKKERRKMEMCKKIFWIGFLSYNLKYSLGFWKNSFTFLDLSAVSKLTLTLSLWAKSKFSTIWYYMVLCPVWLWT